MRIVWNRKQKPFIIFTRKAVDQESQNTLQETTVLRDLREQTEKAWQRAMLEINKEQKSLRLAEYRERLNVYRRQLLICAE